MAPRKSFSKTSRSLRFKGLPETVFRRPFTFESSTVNGLQIFRGKANTVNQTKCAVRSVKVEGVHQTAPGSVAPEAPVPAEAKEEGLEGGEM